MKIILQVFSSLRLTILILVAAIVLVFCGTLAQVHLGLWEAQRRYFQTYFVWWSAGEVSLPVWPGGYLLGWLFLANLLCAYGQRMKKVLSWRSSGLLLIHGGLLLLLLGQFVTEQMQVESSMRLAVGETRTYSETTGKTELAIIQANANGEDTVTVIPEHLLLARRNISDPRLPFMIELNEWQSNSTPRLDRATGALTFAVLPVTRKLDEVNLASARITVRAPGIENRTFFVSTFLDNPLTAGSLVSWARENGLPDPATPSLNYQGRELRIALRFVRHFKFFGGPKPCEITLLAFNHERYPGTQIAKAFSSRVRISNPNTGEQREALISMNTPLRYGGETFYQGGFDPRRDDTSILQVVRNPVWLSPYISCILVGTGLLVHFILRLRKANARLTPSRAATRPGRIAWGATALVAIWAALQLFPVRTKSPMPLDEFGKLPILAGGRVQPIDSLARNSLLSISGRSTVPTPEGRLTAVQWLMEVFARAEVASDLKVFRLENLELRSRLNAREGRFGYVSINDLRPELHSILREVEQIQNTEPARRNGNQRDVMHLYESLIVYQQLKSILNSDNEDATALADAYRCKDRARFTAALANWKRDFQPREGTSRASFEAYFNRVEFFYKATLLYCVALLTAFIYWHRRSESVRHAAFGITCVALVLHTTGLIFRMLIYGRPPVTNLYSSAVFVGWGAVILGLFIERRLRNSIGIIVSSLVGFITQIIAHHLAATGDTMPVLQAVLDTNVWLATHVVIITTGYAAMVLAGTLGIVALMRRQFDRAFSAAELTAIGNAIFGVICFGTLFSFVGTVLGGIWADQSWGRFWGWDPKENGALLIVLWCAVILHGRVSGLLRERGMIIGALIGSIITSFSWFGVNLLGIGLHTYGFMEGAFRWLAIFVASQLVCILWAALSLKGHGLPRRSSPGNRAAPDQILS